MALIRPKDEPLVTTPAVGDALLLDGAAGVRSILVSDFYLSVAAVPYTIVTAAGVYPVVAADRIVLINKTVPAANSVQMPASASRNGVPLIVKDLKGDSDVNVVSVLMNGVELCDGLATVPINAKYLAYKFWPLSTGGWFIAP